jgi:acyl-CoA synthetase (AMP-forming)/AMP-acid ligase II
MRASGPLLGAPLADATTDPFRFIIGCGIPNREELHIDVRIVDPGTCAELGADSVGEIWIDSPSKARGYWGLEERTREEFHCRLAEGGSEDDAHGGHGYCWWWWWW